MKTEYIEKIYAGWLSKIIGIRYGAPVEGWDYDKIRELYGDPGIQSEIAASGCGQRIIELCAL